MDDKNVTSRNVKISVSSCGKERDTATCAVRANDNFRCIKNVELAAVKFLSDDCVICDVSPRHVFVYPSVRPSVTLVSHHVAQQ